ARSGSRGSRGFRARRLPARARTFGVAARAAATGAARGAEHDQLAHVDLGRVFGLAVLVLPLAVLDAPFDIQFVALFDVSLHDVRERRRLGIPYDATVPLRLLLLGSAGVVPRAAGREREC